MEEPRTDLPNDTIGILQLGRDELAKTERRILDKLAENAETGTRRWKTHETEHAEMIERLEALEQTLNLHLKEEADEELVMRARLQPIQKAGLWAAREWRTLVIIALLVADGVQTAIDHGFFK